MHGQTIRAESDGPGKGSAVGFDLHSVKPVDLESLRALVAMDRSGMIPSS